MMDPPSLYGSYWTVSGDEDLMGRWAWRGALLVLVVAALLTVPTGLATFRRACDGSLEGLRYLSNVRAELASATALPPAAPTPAAPPAPNASQPAPPSPPPPPPPTMFQHAWAEVGTAGDAALVTLIQVKQSDIVSYPAHIAAAHTLGLAGCGKDAIRLQWLKAGLHASGDAQVQRIASALAATTSDPDELSELRGIVRTWTERAPRSVSLRRVLTALDEQST